MNCHSPFEKLEVFATKEEGGLTSQVVRYKFSVVLQEWHPSDASAFTVIAPWFDVWREEDYAQFITRTIVPKLLQVLRNEFAVNPQQQYILPFQWVMTWEPILPPHTLLQLLITDFFPKWFHGLHTWLSADPNFDEVSAWYLGWKQQFPPSLREHTSIKAMFNLGLDLMNQALEHKPLDAVVGKITAALSAFAAAPAGRPPTISQAAEAPPARRKPVEVDDTDGMSFREIIEQFAAMNNMMFAPHARARAVDGKRVFSFGTVSVYLDNQAIFAQVDEAGSKVWRPISLQDLLSLARAGSG